MGVLPSSPGSVAAGSVLSKDLLNTKSELGRGVLVGDSSNSHEFALADTVLAESPAHRYNGSTTIPGAI